MLLLRAAEAAVNGKESFLEKRWEFPSFKNDDIDKSDDARIFYKSGTPLLMRYLLFWPAEFLSRMSFYLLPSLFIVLSRDQDRAGLRVHAGRIKINAVYRDLGLLEKRLARSVDGASREDALSNLNQMERSASSLRLPRELSVEHFMLRCHIDCIRTCVTRGEPYVGRRVILASGQPAAARRS